jgi:NADH:ubiquinone oxidoreductase subunit 6 (subunit J)
MIEGITLDQVVLAVLAVGLIVSAFLAIHLDEAMYSVISLACTLILLSVMYWIYDAVYAAIFQLVAGISTLVVMLLAGEMLSEQVKKRDSPKRVVVALVIAAIISLPTMFLTVSISSVPTAPPTSFPSDIWSLRSIDIVLQGLVILVIAIGIAIILTQNKRAAESMAQPPLEAPATVQVASTTQVAPATISAPAPAAKLAVKPKARHDRHAEAAEQNQDEEEAPPVDNEDESPSTDNEEM